MAIGDLLIGASQAPLLARPYYADGDLGPIVAALELPTSGATLDRLAAESLP